MGCPHYINGLCYLTLPTSTTKGRDPKTQRTRELCGTVRYKRCPKLSARAHAPLA